ncbi:ATP-binding protein [Ectothiorhodospira shaposhnikovii]|uniref:ATP-binding protein n=1 Tax=Ectothiorhodospira shaposhnikovii TaxID=1054 RepID=UPI001EE97F15|nr:ATP-binding protein [Ectothiorhodospira shaposhnikovii]MCG5512795.1 ATP-binding protein [Ectothiorhodospira shaposhnikovii]
MMIGVTGAHRVGKSTLCKAFAESCGLPFVQTDVSGVFVELGLDPKEDYDFDIRLMIQGRILALMSKTFEGAPSRFITDRTPIDLLAYTLADVRRTNLSPERVGCLMAYSDACFRVVNRHFSSLVVVQPGIKLVEAEGKAPANPAYIEHINSLIMGLAADERCKATKHYMSRSATDLSERVMGLHRVLLGVEKRHEEVVRRVAIH